MIEQDEYGLFFYPELPDEFRVAKKEDFFDVKKLVSLQTPFLIFGEHWPVYQCYRVRLGFDVDNIRYWLNKGRVFVLR